MLSPKRMGRVTGSAAGAILGLSQYQTADGVLRRMVREYHGAEPEFTGNEATEYGSFHEAGAITDFEMQFNMEVKRNAEFFVHPKYDWLGATPDGFVGDRSVIEVKCPYGLRNHKNPFFKPIEAQQHYYAQVQIEMYCTGKSECLFYQWAPNGYALECVYLDLDWIDENVPKLKAFHERYLSELDNPDHLQPRRLQVTNNHIIQMVNEYDEISDAIERATARKKELLDQIVEATGNRDCDIQGRKLTLVEREGAISYAKALKKYAPDADLEPFKAKPTSYWRLT